MYPVKEKVDTAHEWEIIPKTQAVVASSLYRCTKCETRTDYHYESGKWIFYIQWHLYDVPMCSQGNTPSLKG